MMFIRAAAFAAFCFVVPVASAFAQTAPPEKSPPAPAQVKPAELPAPPPGVTHVEWNRFVKTPVGAYGLQLTDEIKGLNGKKVRLLGYMVMRDQPAPGAFFLAPYQVGIEEHEAGFADLPPQSVYVTVPYNAAKVVPHTPRPLLLIGTLSVGQRRVENGAVVSLFRLALDTPPAKPKAKASAPKPKAKTR